MPQREDFVLLKDNRTDQMIKCKDIDDVEAFIVDMDGKELVTMIWDSLKETFKIGKNVGKKYAVPTVDHKPHFGGEY